MDAVIGAEFANGCYRPGPREAIRVVTWNIERGLKLNAVLDFLTFCEADIILLQEVDLNVRRTKFRDIAQELARSLELNYVFGKQFQELGAAPPGLAAYHGLATLSPWPLSNGRILPFRRQSDFWRPRWYIPRTPLFQRRLGGRIALVAEAAVDGRSLVTYNLHLESRAGDELRVEQLWEVLDDAGRYDGIYPVILGGDFNLPAGHGEAVSALNSAGLEDAVRLPASPTTCSGKPLAEARNIDWIYASGAVNAKGRVYDAVTASDHYPVSASFKLR
jgi:endonuclease/exonuclease/phosphatase family metal-dependent hydrolase